MQTRSRRAAALTLALLLAMGAASTCQAGKRGAERPFKGHARGIATFLSPVEAIIDYTGHATHLGKFTRREYLFINEDGFTFQGTMTFVAANGDELDLDFVGMFISPTDAIGTYTFTGGTGRFVDATGTAEFEAYTPDFVHVRVRFDGTISY
ncbi:hypothetical protein [Maioricimonas sp. JC845]|uniref:hypothetical protein n=1 Tax=Maioricimonas sp. JC845 TaxID=3232138 RepID=UPI00345A67B4